MASWRVLPSTSSEAAAISSSSRAKRCASALAGAATRVTWLYLGLTATVPLDQKAAANTGDPAPDQPGARQ
jgi:hypothetical protein